MDPLARRRRSLHGKLGPLPRVTGGGYHQDSRRHRWRDQERRELETEVEDAVDERTADEELEEEEPDKGSRR